MPEPIAPANGPVYGPLELPHRDEEGPADGLSLDAAIEILVRQYRDALIRHRRAVLRLNTAVALRIVH